MIERNSTEWFNALDAFVAERRNRPFAWGSNDCCTFAADWVLASTGVDPMFNLRGLVTATSAHRELDRRGGVWEATTAALGRAEAGFMAQCGDVVLLSNEKGTKVLGICTGSRLVAPGPDCMMSLSVEAAEAAWRVGV